MRASAAAISFCSSAEGVHTFSTLTLTCGWVDGVSGDCWAAIGKVEKQAGQDKNEFLGSLRNSK